VLISPDKKLIDDLAIDSLGLVELIVMLEEQFDVEFDESVITHQTTVADLERWIESSPKTSARYPQTSWARTPSFVQIRSVMQKILNLYLKGKVSIKVENKEALQGLPYPAIFVANHTSNLDTIVLLNSLPDDVKHKVCTAAAADYFFGMTSGTRTPGNWLKSEIRAILAPTLLNAFPFSREGSIRRSMSQLGTLIDDGWSIIVYPEGSRSQTGEMAPFKPGIGMVAAEMQVPIVPIKITGLHKILPKGSSTIKPGRAELRFGNPIYFSGEDDYPFIAKMIEDQIRML